MTVRWIEVLGPDGFACRGVICLTGNQLFDPGHFRLGDPEYDPNHMHSALFLQLHLHHNHAWMLPHVHDESASAYDSPLGIKLSRERKLRGDL